MRHGELDRDPFGSDEEDEESDDHTEMEIRELFDEVNLPRMVRAKDGAPDERIILRPNHYYNPGLLPRGLGNRFFTTWGSQGVILEG